jgi:hypothetical protein
MNFNQLYILVAAAYGSVLLLWLLKNNLDQNNFIFQGGMKL